MRLFYLYGGIKLRRLADRLPKKTRSGKTTERRFSFVYWLVQWLLRGPLTVICRPKWSGAEHLPQNGGFIAAANHTTEFDSVTYMHFLMKNKIPVRVLCKEPLFKVPIVGAVMRSAKQIPVYRNSDRSQDALRAAKRALSAGECVGVFPEGTITRCPDSWPMVGKTGCARMALQCQAPVIPIVQWGAQDVLDRYCRRPRIFGKHQVQVRAYPEVPLSDLYDRADDPAAWREATDRIIDALTFGLEEIRGLSMQTKRVSVKDPEVLSKKELGLACTNWQKKHRFRRPSERRIGELLPYLEKAKTQIAQAEKSGRKSGKEMRDDALRG